MRKILKLMEVWRAHYDKISNEEFAWDRNGLINVNTVCGPCEKISALKVGVAIGKMKQGKSAGPTGLWQDAQGCGRNWFVVDD